MEKRTSHWADIVAACRQHLLRRAIGGGAYNLSNEVHLSRCNHFTDASDVIEHHSNMFISDAFFLDSCDRDIKDSADAVMMEEDFKLVGESFAHGAGFASP